MLILFVLPESEIGGALSNSRDCFPVHGINLHYTVGNNKQKRVHLYGLV